MIIESIKNLKPGMLIKFNMPMNFYQLQNNGISYKTLLIGPAQPFFIIEIIGIKDFQSSNFFPPVGIYSADSTLQLSVLFQKNIGDIFLPVNKFTSFGHKHIDCFIFHSSLKDAIIQL